MKAKKYIVRAAEHWQISNKQPLYVYETIRTKEERFAATKHNSTLPPIIGIYEMCILLLAPFQLSA